MPSLRISMAGAPTKVYAIRKPVTSLGASSSCDVLLPDPLLADIAAMIQFDGKGYTMAVTGRHDVVVNGRKRKRHELHHGDKISLGGAELVFSLVEESKPAGEDLGEVPKAIAAYERLYEFSARLLEKHHLPDLLDALMDSVIEISSADKGFLILMAEDQMEIKVARNLNKENLADGLSQLSDSVLAKVIRTQKPVIVSDAMNDEEFSASQSVMQLRLTSVICVPLLEKGQLIGLIYVGSDKVATLFTDETLQILSIFAAQASLIISKALLLSELILGKQALARSLDEMRFGNIVGSCRAMQDVFRRIEKVATTDISVLVTGETGTGKELIARAIHERSPRHAKPFVTINCGAIPENLLESELFGYVRGAFTGAATNKIGKFQAADGGTLFLDEIGEMPMNLQVKILRAIQEKSVIRVGDTRPENVDIRILTATHRNLEAGIREGTFREDLYYRLNVINLELPPLRDRGDDIIVIARYLLAQFSREYQSKVKGFSANALIAIKRYEWPGNIREMENRIKKAVVLSEGNVIGTEDLGLEGDQLPSILPLIEAKERWQRQYINEVLALNNGNRTKTARDLGVDPRTIFRHLEKEDPQG